MPALFLTHPASAWALDLTRALLADADFERLRWDRAFAEMEALERGHTVNCAVRFFHNRRDGQEEKYMEIVCTDGRLAGVKVINQTRPDAEGTTTVEGEANQIIHYAFHQMQIDHVGEDGTTSAHFDWSGASQA